ncbi:hypothetical protein J6TS2_51050 [Heyndrickxia sporothermodurans]|nr:hypothetical protein J6TS2_51050 [Heyndrickxia sporothermodurans]
MDPFTLGVVAIGASGATLFISSLFGKKLNEEAVKIALEVTKYGGILYILQHLQKIFF